MLRGINEEKRDYDRARGKRIHDFFLPPGSKIMVCSYVNLRREGMDGYITEFNNMVRKVYGVTGDVGVEVLPVCPVVFEGLDRKGGGELICQLQSWIGWVGENTGRKAVGKLAETGGMESEVVWGGTEIVKPSFLKLHARQGGGRRGD
jgi:hypothetical protein